MTAGTGDTHHAPGREGGAIRPTSKIRTTDRSDGAHSAPATAAEVEAEAVSADGVPKQTVARLAVMLSISTGMFAISFGLLARTAGLGVVPPIVMSVFVFAGSAQFAASSIIRDGGSTVAAIVAALMLNLRYAPISVTVARILPGGRLLRLLTGQLVVDESWAAANRGGGRFDRRVLLVVGSAMWVAWVGGTAIGVLGGKALGDPEAFGLDAAFPALFVALLAPQLRSRPPIVAAALGAAIALALTPFTPAGIPIIVAAGACLIGLKR